MTAAGGIRGFLSQGFRPFFLAAAAWAAVSLVLWIAQLTGGFVLPSRFDPLSWHVHEMLFGFVMAAICGFVLTALPNWTGRQPVGGWRLGLLASSWLLGRVACLVGALIPAWLVAFLDLSCPVMLLAVAARELAAGRNWRNLPMTAPVALLAAANFRTHLEAYGLADPDGLGWRLGLAAVIVLISIISGRIVPNFTRNWLAGRGDARLPAPPGLVDRTALGMLHGGFVGWAFLPNSALFGALLVAGGVLNGLRLARWRGLATLAEPLLCILHLGYAWMAAGSALLGLAVLGWGVPPQAAIHALTAGAIGTMVLAVMTRASRGHTGHPLTADRATIVIYALVNLAAVLRIAAVFAESWAIPVLMLSAASWVAAFSLFLLCYGPLLLHAKATNS